MHLKNWISTEDQSDIHVDLELSNSDNDSNHKDNSFILRYLPLSHLIQSIKRLQVKSYFISNFSLIESNTLLTSNELPTFKLKRIDEINKIFNGIREWFKREKWTYCRNDSDVNLLSDGAAILKLQNDMRQQLKERKRKRDETNSFLLSHIVQSPQVFISKKKLIIFDLNKVLLYRKPCSSIYIARPHVVTFLECIIQWFDVAIWTSSNRQKGKKMVKTVIPENIRELLVFEWYQSQCDRIPYIVDEDNGDTELRSDEEQHNGTLSKNIQKVWKLYPQYSLENTVS